MNETNGNANDAATAKQLARARWILRVGSLSVWMALSVAGLARAQQMEATVQPLPESPGALLAGRDETVPAVAEPAEAAAQQGQPAPGGDQRKNASLPPCPKMSWRWHETAEPQGAQTCAQDNPLQGIVSTGHVQPLTPSGKALLAGREVIDPFNLITIVGYSAIYVAAESHSAYGPGFKGFGRLAGYSLAEDVQGEFFGTFLIPTLAQEDPRYHRMPDQPIKRRILHALAHTVISQHDNGTLMPNYAVLVTYPVSAALSDAYVPGIGTSASDTFKRIGLGYATNPVGDIVAEFLPDVAKRVHIRVVFVQQILNKVAAGSPNTQ